MRYYPYGPFELTRQEDNLLFLEERERTSFFAYVDECEPGLSQACGCYVFALRSGGGTMPWYVGKAEQQTFRKEAIEADKVRKYNSVLQVLRRGTPLLYFYARTTTKEHRFSRPSKSKHGDIRYLEKMLIGFALDRNPSLVNIQETKMLRTLVVPGLLNTPPGRISDAANELKSVLGY